MKPLSGKRIVITGAGGGLGAAYASHAASLGAAVIVNDIDPQAANRTAETIVAAGGQAIAHAGDISNWDFSETLMDSCIGHFGGLDGLINNAGILRPALIADITERDVRRMVEVNLIGTIACARAAAIRMRQAGRGSIVNVASGSQAGDIGLGAYGATKAGVAAFTFSMAMELRDSGIRVNALSPLAETAMAKQNAHLMAMQSASREVRYTQLPDPGVNAPVACYLLSDEADQVHGQVVRIAGRQLSFVTHPMIAAPVIEDDWTFETVAKCFATVLKGSQQKLGLTFSGQES